MTTSTPKLVICCKRFKSLNPYNQSQEVYFLSIYHKNKWEKANYCPYCGTKITLQGDSSRRQYEI